MTRKKTTSSPSYIEEDDEFTPQTVLRNSTLWKNGKPDPRLKKLIRLLAKSAAQQFLEEPDEQTKDKDT